MNRLAIHEADGAAHATNYDQNKKDDHATTVAAAAKYAVNARDIGAAPENAEGVVAHGVEPGARLAVLAFL